MGDGAGVRAVLKHYQLIVSRSIAESRQVREKRSNEATYCINITYMYEVVQPNSTPVFAMFKCHDTYHVS